MFVEDVAAKISVSVTGSGYLRGTSQRRSSREDTHQLRRWGHTGRVVSWRRRRGQERCKYMMSVQVTIWNVCLASHASLNCFLAAVLKAATCCSLKFDKLIVRSPRLRLGRTPDWCLETIFISLSLMYVPRTCTSDCNTHTELRLAKSVSGLLCLEHYESCSACLKDN